MSNKNKLASFFILGLVVVIALVVGFILPQFTPEPSPLSPVAEETQVQTLNFKFDSGDEILEFYDVEINRGETLFEVIKRVTEQNGVEFSYKDFGGELGIFIESINNSSLQESKTKWWQYWVNEEYSQMGVSSYQVKAGDIIVFRFTDDLETE